jgi:hypothetical protein
MSTINGHMCNGKWRPWNTLLCSMCMGHTNCTDKTMWGIPENLSKCTNCNSRWITNAKCDKCGTVMEWIKTDRPYYNLRK